MGKSRAKQQIVAALKGILVRFTCFKGKKAGERRKNTTFLVKNTTFAGILPYSKGKVVQNRPF